VKNDLQAEVALDDPKNYPLKDWMDRDVTEPEDLNSEILVWEIWPNDEGERTWIRSRQEALDYFKKVVLGFDGKEPLDCQATMGLVQITLGDYLTHEGE